MIEIPQNGQYRQINQSDILGNLQGTFNCDFSTVLGKTRVTRMIKTTDSNSVGGFSAFESAPQAFKYFDTLIWFLNGTTHSYIFSNQLGTTVDIFGYNGTTLSTSTSLKGDLEIFSNCLYATDATSVYKKVANGAGTGAWSTISSGLNNTYPHMMCVYGTGSNGKLYVSNCTSTSSDIASYTSGGTENLTALQIPDAPSNLITTIRSGSNKIWICAVNTNKSNGYVYEWDGISTQVIRQYKLDSFGALACIIKDDIPWIMDTDGKLLSLQNGSFVEEARLPIDYKKYLGNVTSTINNRYIHPNGITLINGRINILVNNLINDNAGTIPEFLPSGVWEHDDIQYNQYTGSTIGIGFYHKFSLSYLPVGTNTITDYGQNRISSAGALTYIKVPDTTIGATGVFLAGAMVYTDATTTLPAIFTNDTFDATTGTTGQYNTLGAGYLVTTKQFAIDDKGNHSIQNTWLNIYTLYRKLMTASSGIRVKYRILDAIPLSATITWTSTTTFTTTTNVLGLEGYEVEVVQGTGSGFCSHISKIDVTSSIYTVTILEACTGATGTAKVRIQNWKLISTISPSGATYDQAGIGDLSNWVQFKIYMLFSLKDELEKLIVVNNNTLPAH